MKKKIISVNNDFQQLLINLHQERKQKKQKVSRKYRLNFELRKLIYAKAGGKCHVCGSPVKT